MRLSKTSQKPLLGLSRSNRGCFLSNRSPTCKNEMPVMPQSKFQCGNNKKWSRSRQNRTIINCPKINFNFALKHIIQSEELFENMVNGKSDENLKNYRSKTLRDTFCYIKEEIPLNNTVIQEKSLETIMKVDDEQNITPFQPRFRGQSLYRTLNKITYINVKSIGENREKKVITKGLGYLYVSLDRCGKVCHLERVSSKVPSAADEKMETFIRNRNQQWSDVKKRIF